MAKKGVGGTRGAKRKQVPRSLPVGAKLICADNSGARVIEIISVIGYKSVLNRYPKAGVGDMISCSVKKGKPELKKQILRAVIVRQKKEYMRFDGSRIKFEDNAAVIIAPDGMMKGSEVRGPVAKEVAEMWPRVAAAASIVA